LVATGASRPTYDAFGEVRTESGTLSTDFLFTGEQFDAKARQWQGLYYLRARYYDPSTGRFLTRDPVPAPERRPETLNAYPYVGGNPVNFIDPTGLWCPRNPEDCVPDPVEDFFTETVPEAVSSVNWRNVAVGGTLMAAGGGLIAVSIVGLVIIVPAELAAAPESGLLTALMVPHTIGVIGWVGFVGVGTFACGLEVMRTGECLPHASHADAWEDYCPGWSPDSSPGYSSTCSPAYRPGPTPKE
jgi:RHS repeat-associated protein